MKLEIDYLRERHGYWRQRIGEAGIWDASKFQDVTLQIKGDSRRCNALFQRRVRRKGAVREVSDKIVVYNKVEDFDPRFLDSVLVHEMIHQYIFQNDLKDTRAHGAIFRSFRERINAAFENELKINITDHNPSLPEKGPGKKIHTLLLLFYESGEVFIAVVNKTKKDFFENLIRRNKKRWSVKDFKWAQSIDVHFDRYSRCTRSLHGLKRGKGEMAEFCKEYGVYIIS